MGCRAVMVVEEVRKDTVSSYTYGSREGPCADDMLLSRGNWQLAQRRRQARNGKTGSRAKYVFQLKFDYSMCSLGHLVVVLNQLWLYIQMVA